MKYLLLSICILTFTNLLAQKNDSPNDYLGSKKPTDNPILFQIIHVQILLYNIHK